MVSVKEIKLLFVNRYADQKKLIIKREMSRANKMKLCSQNMYLDWIFVEI